MGLALFASGNSQNRRVESLTAADGETSNVLQSWTLPHFAADESSALRPVHRARLGHQTSPMEEKSV